MQTRQDNGKGRRQDVDGCRGFCHLHPSDEQCMSRVYFPKGSLSYTLRLVKYQTANDP